MNFVEDARVILQHQSQLTVERFLVSVQQLFPLPDDLGGDSFLNADDDDIKQIKKDKKALEKFVQKHPNCLPNAIVDWRIDNFERILGRNDLLNTKGRPTQLTFRDLLSLHMLREIFRIGFPELRSEYRGGTLLKQLGEVLIDKPLPKSIEQMLKKNQQFHKYTYLVPP